MSYDDQGSLTPYSSEASLSDILNSINNLTKVIGAIGDAFGAEEGVPVYGSPLVNTGASADQSAIYLQPTTGFSATIPNACSWLNLDPAGTLATATVVMPMTPIDGQNIVVSSSQMITALTVSPSAGQTLNDAPTTIAANASFQYRFRLANTTWYRLR